MSLTGRRRGPCLGVPTRLVRELDRLGEVFGVDGVALLGERAALTGGGRGGEISCGGVTRLVEALDGWLAVSLAREDDIALLPAWLDIEPNDDGDPWREVIRLVAARRADELVDAASDLGIPVASVGEAASVPALAAIRLGDAAPTQDWRGLRVVDLSSLWAGPLCGQLLADAGLEVVKVESSSRPDGARRGPTAFFDLMNAGKSSVALDLTGSEGVAALRSLLLDADVIIEASRARALEQMGIDVPAVFACGTPKVWVSITGFGRVHNRVAFGDDAAAAGGLVASDRDGPLFCADAVADPATGLIAAAAVLEHLGSGGQWLLDVSLAGVAASLVGGAWDVERQSASPPRARPSRGAAAPLGADTAVVLSRSRR